MFNERPFGKMNNEKADELELVTRSMLMTGYDINVCPNYTLPKVKKRLIHNRADIVRYSKPMKALYYRILGKLYFKKILGRGFHEVKSSREPNF